MRILPLGDLGDPAAALYNERAETRLVHCFEPEPGLFIAETPVVIRRALEAGYEPVSMIGEEKIVRAAAAELAPFLGEIPVYAGTDEVLRGITGYHLARGLLCALRRRPPAPAESVLAGASRLVLLEEVLNPTNVGAVFRSAAALGMDGVLLSARCTDPLYRRASRVSMGNVFQIPWTFLPKTAGPAERIGLLRAAGFRTLAMALTKTAVPLGALRVRPGEKIAMVMGTESTGLAPETVAACDEAVVIPMKNGVDSLNVAAAAAVAFWELRERQDS